MAVTAQIPETMEKLAMGMMEHLTIQRQKCLNGSSETVVAKTIYKCRKCRDSGYYEVEHDGYTFMRECECGNLQRQRLAGKLKFATIPKEFEGQTVANFCTDCYLMPQNRKLAEMVKRLAENYVKQFPEIMKTGKGLYFHSSIKGSGKTRLAVSIANDIITNYMISAKFATTLQILDQIRNTWGREKERGMMEQASEQRLIDDIISVPVLVIDDIGVEQPKDWVKERFYNILNGRMNENRITIFTSNYQIENLQLEERIVSRIEKMAMPVGFPSESVRKSVAEKENNALMDRLLGL